MEEARQVLERLARIDTLRKEGAPANSLLAEVRGLLVEGERWLATEGPAGTQRARVALDECGAGLATPEEVATATRL
jgi:hypothetical protein